MIRNSDFDVIVVGAGHAGVEACLASARLGLSTLLVTTNTDRIAYMSCNPSIGGLAKGHMVREIDVMGGEMGLAADATCIQFKRLNSKKGPAVRGSRVQSDKHLYSKYMTEKVFSQPNLTVKQGEVKRLILDKQICVGVVLHDGSEIFSKATIITTGTFMNGVMHVGLKQTPGGRVGDQASIGLSDQLREFGFTVQRLKTGTPARLHKDSIDWSKTIPQHGDEKFYPFSFRSPGTYQLPQIECYLSRTTEQTHEIIRKNLDKSPMYCGVIEGTGPRYCPSIEDKVVRFADKGTHQTFLEPEGLNTDLIYLQGISTSLPEDVQMDFLRTIPGLENVKVVRFGYAVEYDYIEPTQIWHRLETRPIQSLFLAGQINGTSGYEEAAAQGFMAGVNAAHSVLGRSEFILGRDQAYIGVLVDDLVTKGTREPYRMFTSRAEHRLVLREDNTIDRLGDTGNQLGLMGETARSRLENLQKSRSNLLGRLRETKVYPTADLQARLAAIPTPVLGKSISFEELLRRAEIDCSHLPGLGFDLELDPNVCEPVEIEVKYSGYVKRQMDLIAQSKKMEDLVLDEALNYKDIRGLSHEEIEKLSRVKPRTLGQAQRISGVNPSAVQAIMIYLKGRKKVASEYREERSRIQSQSIGELISGFADLSPEIRIHLKKYHEELLKFNKTVNLIGVKTIPMADAIHFADSILAARLIEKDSKSDEIYDFGSGNGFPGLVFALMMPQRRFHLVEMDPKKAEFLKHMISALGLKNTDVMIRAIETLSDSSVKCAVARGFAPLSKSILAARKIIPTGGVFYHLKGEEWATEIADIPTQLCSYWLPSLLGEYRLPIGEVKFAVVKTEKIKD